MDHSSKNDRAAVSDRTRTTAAVADIAGDHVANPDHVDRCSMATAMDQSSAQTDQLPLAHPVVVFYAVHTDHFPATLARIEITKCIAFLVRYFHVVS